LPIVYLAMTSRPLVKMLGRQISCLTFATALLAMLGAQTSRSVWDGVYAEEQAKRGEVLYAKACASCHGVDLAGGEQAPPLAGAAFLANWHGLTAGDLFERIRQTMPQDKPGSLSRPQNADVLAYMFQANRFPAGTTELDRQTEVLKQIRIEAEKPN